MRVCLRVYVCFVYRCGCVFVCRYVYVGMCDTYMYVFKYVGACMSCTCVTCESMYVRVSVCMLVCIVMCVYVFGACR